VHVRSCAPRSCRLEGNSTRTAVPVPFDVKTIRDKLHLSQTGFAALLGVSVHTLQDGSRDGALSASRSVDASRPPRVDLQPRSRRGSRGRYPTGAIRSNLLSPTVCRNVSMILRASSRGQPHKAELAMVAKINGAPTRHSPRRSRQPASRGPLEAKTLVVDCTRTRSFPSSPGSAGHYSCPSSAGRRSTAADPAADEGGSGMVAVSPVARLPAPRPRLVRAE